LLKVLFIGEARSRSTPMIRLAPLASNPAWQLPRLTPKKPKTSAATRYDRCPVAITAIVLVWL
jgi:hypothetical protein